MTAIFGNPRDLLGHEGEQLGPTDWLTIDQKRVDGFAEVTGDHQWIHIDVERAKAGPFGGTIVHGYLTMSLAIFFLPLLIEVRGFAHAVNVGADRLRFAFIPWSVRMAEGVTSLPVPEVVGMATMGRGA